jgi:hypothetical protein
VHLLQNCIFSGAGRSKREDRGDVGEEIEEEEVGNKEEAVTTTRNKSKRII